jgi:glycosyltransferase involved in cell wall biosynthesis
VARFIAISQSTADKLVAHGVDADRIEVIPCGYDPSVVAAIGPQPAPARPRLVVVGRLVPYKRVDLVIQALARLTARHPELELLVIGRGPEHDRLVELAHALGVADRVRFAGHLPSHSDVLREVAASTAFVSASEIEGFGIAVVEASALGCPIVVSDIPVFDEVTAGGTGGLMFRTGDATHLADQLGRLLDDAGLREASSRAGRAHAARYHWSEVAERTAATLQGTIRPSNRSSHVERPVP